MSKVVTEPSVSVYVEGWESPPPYMDNPYLRTIKSSQFLENFVLPETIGSTEEIARFCDMNYCSYYASNFYQKVSQVGGSQKEYMEWIERYNILKLSLLTKNMGLVYDMISKSRFDLDYNDMQSDGTYALLRSLEAFDPWRGFRFSTYACNAILKAFSRLAQKEMRKVSTEPVSFDMLIEKSDAPEVRKNDQEELILEKLVALLKEGKIKLNDKETLIINRRFFNSPKCTLEEVGKEIGLSKERVRQIQNIALTKIKDVLMSEPILQ